MAASVQGCEFATLVRRTREGKSDILADRDHRSLRLERRASPAGAFLSDRERCRPKDIPQAFDQPHRGPVRSPLSIAHARTEFQSVSCNQRNRGPVLIIAGPGSGKTYTLVERIVRLIQHQGLKPEELLVVTFTQKAARELVTRVSNRLRELGISFNINEMYIGTFHSICLRMLKDYLNPDDPRTAWAQASSVCARTVKLHTSGHASPADLSRFATAMAPTALVPVHGHAWDSADIPLPPVQRLGDGETWLVP